MGKSKWIIMRQTITIVTAFAAAFSVFYSIILNSAVSTAISLCYQSSEKENICMDSCCSEIGTSQDCCCYFSEIPDKNDTLISYELFGKSINNYMCAIHTFNNSNFTELYSVNYETQNNPKYIVNKIFRPPKV